MIGIINELYNIFACVFVYLVKGNTREFFNQGLSYNYID